LAVTNFIALSVLGNATISYAAVIKESKPVISQSVSSSESAIVRAIQGLKKDIELKGLPVEIAAATFTDKLVDAKVSVADLDSFVKKSSSPKDYLAFRSMVEMAKVSASEGEMTPQEFGMVVSEALKSVDSKGLAWSGCASLATGIVLAVGAVVVGIVAITTSESVKSIKKRHAEKRSGPQNTYETAVSFQNNRVEDIEKAKDEIKWKIQKNDVDIAYYQDLMAKETSQTIRFTYSQKIDQLKNSTINLNADRASLQIEQDNYSDPAYLKMKLDIAKATYDDATRDSFTNEAKEIEQAPANKALATKLGISAGVGAALGAYLIVDGADC
jgi:hypothetical protein